MSNMETVEHPKHYATSMPPIQVECIDFARNMDFCQGNAFKYVWRAGHKKDGVEDLRKALWYLERCKNIEITEFNMNAWLYISEKLYLTAKTEQEKKRIILLDDIAEKRFFPAIEKVKDWIVDIENNGFDPA